MFFTYVTVYVSFLMFITWQAGGDLLVHSNQDGVAQEVEAVQARLGRHGGLQQPTAVLLNLSQQGV